MMNDKIKTLFMGTPDFAQISLAHLANADLCEIAGVVTQPDKPRGRGYALCPPPVKVFAQQRGFPVYQPETLRCEAFTELLREIDPELIVVVAYGKLLPSTVLHYPKYGCINVHASLLPQYRGAAPIQRAIMEGRAETGVTIMFLNEGMDTGDMLQAVPVPIQENDDFACIHDRLAEAGAGALLSTIEQLRAGTARPQKQDERLATYAAKIEKEDREIDFLGMSAKEVHNLIRGLCPVPLAYTIHHGKMVKVIKSIVLDQNKTAGQPGEVLSVDRDIIAVACRQGIIGLTEILPEGKKRMSAGDFIRGRNTAPGDRFGS